MTTALEIMGLITIGISMACICAVAICETVKYCRSRLREDAQ